MANYGKSEFPGRPWRNTGKGYEGEGLTLLELVKEYGSTSIRTPEGTVYTLADDRLDENLNGTRILVYLEYGKTRAKVIETAQEGEHHAQ